MLESWIAGGGVHCHTNDQPMLVPEPGVPLQLLAGVLGLGFLNRRRAA
jgi:hypothetical protein